MLFLLAFTSADIIFHKFLKLHSALSEKKDFCFKFSFFRGDVHTQSVMPNIKSMFVGGWVLITDVLVWQFGDALLFQGIEISCYEDCQVLKTHCMTIIHHWSPTYLAFTSL